MIKYIVGDVLESNANVIAHGVNCVGGFGSGVAGQIANKYPLVRDYYLDQFENIGWKLGDVQYVPLAQDKLFANCATQKEYYPRDKRNCDYEAVAKVMEELNRFCRLNKFTLAIPKIGAGLAGGDWVIIETIINRTFGDQEVLVYTLD